MAVRTGYKGWENLEQYDLYSGNATGLTKSNSPGDPDYVPPVYDPGTCEPQEELMLFVTSSTLSSYNFSLNSGATPVIMEARVGNTVIRTIGPSATPSKTMNMGGDPGNRLMWVRGSVGFAPSVVGLLNNNGQVLAVSFQGYPNIASIELRDNLLISIDVSMLSGLTTLVVPGNNIVSMDISMNTGLLYLEADGNSLTSLVTSGNPDLVWCLAGSNSISSVDFTTNTSLGWVRLNNNPLSAVDVSMLTVLERLEVASTGISTLSLGANVALKVVNASLNNLTGLSLSGLVDLEVLEVSNNNITSIDLTDNTKMQQLRIDINDLTSLNVSMLTDLELLVCVKNPSLATLDISALNNLTELRCGECDFTADDADPSIIDAIIIKMDSNIVSGGVLHYDTVTPGGIQPTSASLAAYNSLVSKGCNLQGKVPS